MSPLDHLEWAGCLPRCGDSVDLPLPLQEAVHLFADLGHAGVASKRSKAEASWMERKGVLDLEWADRFGSLPENGSIVVSSYGLVVA